MKRNRQKTRHHGWLSLLCLGAMLSTVPACLISEYICKEKKLCYIWYYQVGPISWLMLRHIFPSNVRRRAITAAFYLIFAFANTKLYQNLVELVSPGWALWHFAVACIIGTAFVYLFVPETKGRTLEDIHNEFEGIH